MDLKEQNYIYDIHLKGIIHPKKKILSSCTLMSLSAVFGLCM